MKGNSSSKPSFISFSRSMLIFGGALFLSCILIEHDKLAMKLHEGWTGASDQIPEIPNRLQACAAGIHNLGDGFWSFGCCRRKRSSSTSTFLRSWIGPWRNGASLRHHAITGGVEGAVGSEWRRGSRTRTQLEDHHRWRSIELWLSFEAFSWPTKALRIGFLRGDSESPNLPFSVPRILKAFRNTLTTWSLIERIEFQDCTWMSPDGT